MKVFIKDVSFIAQPVGQPHDFKSLFLILNDTLELDKEFGFSRKPTVDYFYSTNPASATTMVVGNNRKGKGILVPTSVDIGKLTLRRTSATTLTSIQDKVSYIPKRSHSTFENGVLSIGSRTSDFYYTATLNEAKETVETLQLRPPYATQVRMLLIAGEELPDLFDALMQEVLNLGIYNSNHNYEFVKRNSPARREKATEASKQAQSLARRLFTYWINENQDILSEVCSQARPIFDKMIQDELERRSSSSDVPPTEKPEQESDSVGQTLDEPF